MNDYAAAFVERERQWRSLRSVLERSLGTVEAIRWMECATAQMRRDLERKARPLEQFPVQPGSPESVL